MKSHTVVDRRRTHLLTQCVQWNSFAVHNEAGWLLGMTKVDVEEYSGPQHDGRTMFLANHLIPQ